MMKSRKRSSVLLAALVLMIAGAASVAQRHFMAVMPRPNVTMQLSGVVERGSERMAFAKDTVVNKGEILDWMITSENTGNADALRYKAVAHIPANTTFVADSVKADGAPKVLFSIDGGKTFSAQPMIEEKQPDGSTKRVPAPVSMYTELRYEWADPLVQGGKLSASYKVRVN